MWPSVAKLLLAGLHPLTIALYVQIVPGLLFLLTLRGFRLPARDRPLLLATAVLGGTLGPISYLFGLERTTAVDAALLGNTEALFTILFGFALLGERINRPAYGAMAAIALGAFMVTTEWRFGDVQFFTYIVGNLLLIAAAGFWALNGTGSTVLLRRVRILPLLTAQFLVGTAFMLPIAAVSGAPLIPSIGIVPGLVFLGLSGVAAFSVLYFHAFRTIGVMRTGSILSTSSIWGVLIALVLFPEQALGLWQVVGGALMIVALIALYRFSEGPPSRHKPKR